MKIGFATMEGFENRASGSVGSSMIRARWLYSYWPEAEEFKLGEDYDVIVFQKVFWADMMRNFKGIKILDICDPVWLEGKPVIEFAQMADAVTTSTQALADYIAQFVKDKPVICIPDRVELKEFPYHKEKHEGDLKRVVWFGYHHNFHYVEQCIPELVQKRIELTVISDQPMAIPTGFPGATIENIKYQQESLVDELLKHDAALLPEVQSVDLKGKYKSNNKDIQCWALGLPVIKLPEDIDKFQDPAVRTLVSINNRLLVEKKYDVKISVDEYKDLITKIQAGRKV